MERPKLNLLAVERSWQLEEGDDIVVSRPILKIGSL